MSIKQQTQPSLFGMAASTLTNGLGMINNAFIAGERVTYIAASKASNLAEISDVADTLKLVVAKKELDDKCKELGVQVDAQGNMSF
jgi:hypothetical protein